jgi:hypothetical protein
MSYIMEKTYTNPRIEFVAKLIFPTKAGFYGFCGSFRSVPFNPKREEDYDEKTKPNGKWFAKKLRKPAPSKGAKTAHLLRAGFCNFCKPILFRYSGIVSVFGFCFDAGNSWQN